ncbi:MAG: hypothetical protein LiPW16_233 [Microgenomates group bacterium LiPW_16]|nr:MAG: hypothetical protein LiPW16_233 [Microgenomates group bacterium LiPW_16]
MKNSIKQFLKLEWRKGLIFIFLTGISLLLVYPDYPLPADFYTVGRGWPLPYLTINIGGGVTQGVSIFYLGLVTDLIFWYLISCLIIFIYNKLRGKRV